MGGAGTAMQGFPWKWGARCPLVPSRMKARGGGGETSAPFPA